MSGEPTPPRLPTGFRLVALDSVGSTNDELRARAQDGAPEGTIVWARRQEAGRGRRGRGWNSPEGNLYSSFLLRPGCGSAEAGQLAFVAALAVADTVASFLPDPTRCRLKWPNDVLVDGAKISGILLESAAAPQGTVDWVVIGIGINLASHPDVQVYKTISVAAAAGAAPTAESALERLAGALAGWASVWREAGFAAIRSAWLERAQGLGQPIVARLDDRTEEGVFESLGDDGTLLLRRPDGTYRRIAAGDVFLPAA